MRILKALTAAVDRLAFWMFCIAGATLMLMVGVTVYDIATRTLFAATGGSVNITIRGAVEIVRYSLLITLLFTLPHGVSRAQVIVDVFTENWWQKDTKIRVSGLYTFGFFLLGLGMCLGFHESAVQMAATGQTTQDLEIPKSVFYNISSFATGVLALRSLTVAVQRVFGVEPDVDPDEDAEVAVI